MSTDGNSRPSRLASILVVAAWIALAVAANIVAAVVGAPSPHAQTAAEHQIAQAFPGTGTDAIAYLVLDGAPAARDPLGPADQQYYDAAVKALRADTAHVGSVLDWWSDPLMVPMGTSADGRSGMALVWLRGEAGSGKARESLDAVRSVVRNLPPSPGLRARITVPAAGVGTSFGLSAWQAGAIVAAVAAIALLLVFRAGRSVRSVAGVLLTIGLSFAVAWPLPWCGWLVATLAAALMIGVIAASTLLVTGQDRPPSRHSYREMLPALAAPGAAVTLLTGPLLLARTPGAHGLGLATLGVVVALGASLTLLPAVLGEWAERPAARPIPVLSRVARPALVVALVLGICALPLLGTHWGVGESPVRTSSAHFSPHNRLPDVLMVKATHDLRDPAGLIAIDALSRRLMDIPGVRKVQSAAWPGGVPWADASLSSAAGRLSDQLDRQAATFLPQVTAIKTLGSVLDQVSGSVDELEASVRAGVGGLTQLQQAINSVVSGTRNIKDTAAEASGYLDPVRGWMSGVPDCAADVLCSAVRKAIDPFDRVIADVTVLSEGADRIAAGSTRATGALSATPRAVAQMRSALGQLRSFVPTLQTTIESTIPQVVQLSAFLKNLSVDFANTGEGGFYLPRKALADPSYQHVRQTMFSSDGTATRLLVYSDTTRLDLDAASRAQQIETAVTNATKYGSLVDTETALTGGAQAAATVRADLDHDVTLLAVTMIAVLVLVSAWRGAAGGVLVGLGTAGAFLAGLGVAAALCQYVFYRSLDAAVVPASFGILAACGVPYLVAALAPARQSLAPLVAAGGVLGVGLALVGAGGSIGQVGVVVVIGLVAVTAVAQIGANPGSRVHSTSTV
ncbi:hypothetical protein A5634_17580 [Mycobacterium asiaticum]|uniref:Membrane transport protein MMPL domain-containing protein n=1 Tax=Mycobacterium asiaticum TaxID=1790 RepID=A0A1A3P6R8_MYCAS|nr:MMPL family transporter [Mycobacterium asiaticum]OBK29861.1 hypothetical protein A5634_17580 [Mycobacterium asiaticum]